MILNNISNVIVNVTKLEISFKTPNGYILVADVSLSPVFIQRQEVRTTKLLPRSSGELCEAFIWVTLSLLIIIFRARLGVFGWITSNFK